MDVAEIFKKYGVTKAKKVIRGGTSRMESALAGVSEVSCGTKLIAIHDGARPLVTQDVISRAVYAASDYLAAVPAIPSVDTLKNVEDERVIATLDRECIMRVQTPQVFDADLIKGAADNGRLLRDRADGREGQGRGGRPEQYQAHHAERRDARRGDSERQRRRICG